MISKQIVFLSALLLSSSLHGFKIITTGTPKSGISMLTDILCAITRSKRKATITGDVLLHPDQMLKLGTHFDILVGTPVCNEHNLELVEQHDAHIIYILRDPRDQLCSTAQTIYDHRRYIPGADGKSFDTILLELITEGSQYYAAQYPFDELYQMHGIADLYALWTPWLTHKHTLVVSFEKLSGSDAQRMTEIKRIAEFLKINISDATLKEVTHKRSSSWFGLFTKQPTVGLWKKKFKTEHKEAFNTCGAQLCAQLGYEL